MIKNYTTLNCSWCTVCYSWCCMKYKNNLWSKKNCMIFLWFRIFIEDLRWKSHWLQVADINKNVPWWLQIYLSASIFRYIYLLGRRTDCGEAGSTASRKQGVWVGRSCNMALGKKWEKMKFSSEEHMNRCHKSFSNWITCFFHKFIIFKIDFTKKQLIFLWNHHSRLFCACRNLARRIFASRKLGKILVSDCNIVTLGKMHTSSRACVRKFHLRSS